jgi:EVE domain
MSRNWVAVASAEHVRLGRNRGFMQVCHGKAAPLRRIQPGDGVVYYSPTNVFRSNDGLQSFTAIGVVRDGSPYQADMGGGFTPFRRDVDWREAEEVPIKPLVGQLQFTTAKPNWGYQLRFGLFEISATDIAMIADAMGAEWSHDMTAGALALATPSERRPRPTPP